MRDLTLSFIASTNSAFRVVENKEFIQMIEYISQTKAKLPTTKTLMSDLNQKFGELKQKLKEKIAKAKYLCLTADVWTNKSRSFLGVSIHFFDENLDKQSYLLAFRRVYGRHTYAVLADMILAIQKEFNIKRSKVTHIVTDGASNFKKAFIVFGPQEMNENMIHNVNVEQEDLSDKEEIEFEVEDVLGPETEETTIYFPPDTIHETLNLELFVDDEDDDGDEFAMLPRQMRCVAHALNLLGTTDFEKSLKITSLRCFNALTTAYGKLKRFWEVNSRSSVAHEIIQKVCKRSFPYPNTTRWNSKFDSISVAEKNRISIKEAIEEINKEANKNGTKKTKNLLQISNNEWKILKDYSTALRPVAIGLDILQGDKRASQGYVLPTMFVIKEELEENMRADDIFVSEYGETMNECVLKSLESRFGSVMKLNEENKELILAAAIHPNFKISWIEDERDREYAQTLLINTYIESSHAEKSTSSPSIIEQLEINSTTENQFFKRLRKGERRNSNDDSLTFDVWKYLLQPTDDANLEQIRVNPILEEIFRRYNTTLSASAAIERIFSKALRVFTPSRNRISDQNFEKVLFVQNNCKLLK